MRSLGADPVVESRAAANSLGSGEGLGQGGRVVVPDDQVRVVVELDALVSQASAEVGVLDRGVGESIVETAGPVEGGVL